MDVATISMPADQAREKLAEYQAGLAGRQPTDEDRGVMIGYAALAKGRTLLNLNETFRKCPLDDKGRPKLAVARAHWRHAHLQKRSIRSADGSGWVDRWCFAQLSRHLWGRGQAGRLFVPLPADGTRATSHDWRALVPIIPPNLRPAPSSLRTYHILWEAEWEQVPPVDPMLLRHLHGTLYAVFAVWDLTELERAVLSGRLTERS